MNKDQEHVSIKTAALITGSLLGLIIPTTLFSLALLQDVTYGHQLIPTPLMLAIIISATYLWYRFVNSISKGNVVLFFRSLISILVLAFSGAAVIGYANSFDMNLGLAVDSGDQYERVMVTIKVCVFAILLYSSFLYAVRDSKHFITLFKESKGSTDTAVN